VSPRQEGQCALVLFTKTVASIRFLVSFGMTEVTLGLTGARGASLSDMNVAGDNDNLIATRIWD
jgi:hypothetical protein